MKRTLTKAGRRDIYVQYGCGWCAPSGWVNFDASLTLRFERIPIIGRLYTKNAERFPPNVLYGDVTRGLPLPDGCCAGIYASHVLEHLALEDLNRALGETRRLLRPGGVFRLVVPDLAVLAERYVSAMRNADPGAASSFMRESGLGLPKRPSSLIARLSRIYGGSAHLWMWDYLSLEERLRAHGFKSVRKAAFNDSEDLRFREVEQVDRFRNSIAAEARNPN